MMKRLLWWRKPQPTLLRRGVAPVRSMLSASMPDHLSVDDARHLHRLQQRQKLLRLFTGGLYGLLLLRIAYLGIMQPERTSGNGIANLNQRADIVDRNGVPMAVRISTADLIAEPHRIIDVPQAIMALRHVFPDLTEAELQAKIGDPDKRYVVIKRSLPPQQQQDFHDFGIPGFHFERRARRFYPQGSLTAHITGFTDSDNKGLSGIEKTFDAAMNGADKFTLSIDVNVQYAMHRALSNTMTKMNAQGAAGLLMRAADGQILGLVSLPDYDPNVRRIDADANRFNRVTSGVYEMGSSFKIFNTAIALETGVVKITDKFDVTGPYYTHGHPISDFHAHNGFLSVSDIFRKSSNIGSAHMAERFPQGAQKLYLGKLGLLNKPVFDLPENAAPLLPAQWGPVETITIAYGYGLAVTPLMLTTAVAMVVNGGLVVQPTLLMKGPSTTPPQRVFSAQTAATMRKLMRLVVEPGGTGVKADVVGYPVIGKTGTANKSRTGVKGYDGSACIASFVGAFPYKQPEYVLLVMVDGARLPGFTKKCPTGGLVAAPAAHDIIAAAAPLLGLPPEMAPAVRDDHSMAAETNSSAGEDADPAGEN